MIFFLKGSLIAVLRLFRIVNQRQRGGGKLKDSVEFENAQNN